MKRHTKFAAAMAVIAALIVPAPANALSINKSIKVEAGAEVDGASSVNGSISIGEGATVNGSVDTVNGTIRVDKNAKIDDAGTVNGSVRIASGVTAEDVSSVNGSIRIGENVIIEGGVSVVNGKISLDKGTQVAESVINVNGQITVVGAQIGGDLETVSGDVMLTEGSTLMGNLIVEEPGGWSCGKKRRTPKIIIGPNSTVAGNIELEQEVELYISESAEVGGVSGEMSIDDAVRFSGSTP